MEFDGRCNLENLRVENFKRSKIVALGPILYNSIWIPTFSFSKLLTKSHLKTPYRYKFYEHHGQ
jgi:hypothetical protein